MKVFINLGNKVNVMTLIYVVKLALKVCFTDVGAQKIDDSIFKTFGIILTSFQVEDKLEKIYLF